MKKTLIACMAVALSLQVAQAQDGKLAKKAAVAEAKAEVAAEKAELKLNKAACKMDKMKEDKAALKEDRKAMIKAEGKLKPMKA